MSGSNVACSAGTAGAGVATLCCLSVAPVVGLISALGLGFLLTDLVLIPLLLVSLGVVLWGLWAGARLHGRRTPLGLGLVAAPLAVVGVYLWPRAAYLGLAGVIGAALWNLIEGRQAVRPPA